METEVLKVTGEADANSAVRRAVEVLGNGGLVAFPTETVYGLGVRVDAAKALARLRKIKSRPARKPFTVHIGSTREAERFAPSLSGLAARFIRKGWPGPLTLVLPVDDPKSAPVMADLSATVNPDLLYAESTAAEGTRETTIGLRCPDHQLARTLIADVAAPVVAASANPAGEPAPTDAESVLEKLGGRIDLLIDGGRTRYDRPSTIVRVAGRSYTVLREGVYDAGVIERMSVLRLLLVCTGNTCRSPMAEGLARMILADRLGCTTDELASRGIVVSSAGTFGGGGEASRHAVAVLKRRGIDLSGHTSAALGPEDIRQADFVFCMTQSHRDAVIRLVPSAEDRTFLLADGDIHDPIGGGEDDYEKCARLVEEGLRVRLQEVIE